MAVLSWKTSYTIKHYIAVFPFPVGGSEFRFGYSAILMFVTYPGTRIVAGSDLAITHCPATRDRQTEAIISPEAECALSLGDLLTGMLKTCHTYANASLGNLVSDEKHASL